MSSFAYMYHTLYKNDDAHLNNCTLQYGDTPLHLAIKRGHTTCVKRLLSTPGIDVNSRNEHVSCT